MYHLENISETISKQCTCQIKDAYRLHMKIKNHFTKAKTGKQE